MRWGASIRMEWNWCSKLFSWTITRGGILHRVNNNVGRGRVLIFVIFVENIEIEIETEIDIDKMQRLRFATNAQLRRHTTPRNVCSIYTGHVYFCCIAG